MIIKYICPLFFWRRIYRFTLSALRLKQKEESEFQTVEIKDIRIELPLRLDENKPTTLQVLITEEDSDHIAIYSRKVIENEKSEWLLHAQSQGTIAPALVSINKVDLEDIKAQCVKSIDTKDFYRKLAQQGLEYGKAFQVLSELYCGVTDVFGRIECDDISDNRYQIYPPVLDGALQSLAALVMSSNAAVYLPVGFEGITLYQPLIRSCYVHATLDKNVATASADIVTVGLSIYDNSGMVLAKINGFKVKKATKAALAKLVSGADNIESWCYGESWQEYALVPSAAESDIKIINYDARSPENEISLNSPLKLLAFLKDLITNNNSPIRVNIITENATQHINLNQAMLNGFIKTAIMEHPELSIRHLDVDRGQDIEPLLTELNQDNSNESLFSYRDNQWYVARIEKQVQLNRETKRLGIPLREYRLIKSDAGVIDELQLVSDSTEFSPGEHDVVIEPKAVGLNFRDVLNAMNLYPGDPGPLGGDFSGTIKAIGNQVTGYQIGDEVLGLAMGSLASQTMTNDALMTKKPAALTFSQAATIPTIFLTAYYSLITLAKLKEGETVLIHAAAGGVGLAAIQIAQYCKATIIATAGSDEKRAYLKSLGVDHVLDSRSLTYREEIARITNNKGVEVVLNSLTGPGFIEASLAATAKQGRFLEIGKRDIWSHEQFTEKRADVTYHIVALDTMSAQEPQKVQQLFKALMSLFENKTLTPIHYTEFPLSQSIDAFKYLQQAKQIGKVIITLPSAEITFNRYASYLITGGLGGVGLEVAKYLSEHGAGRIILAARSAPSQSAQEVIAQLQSQGTLR